MRVGVLDIGSNSGHLLVVDAFRGGSPTPVFSYKEPLGLAMHLDVDDAISREGVDKLVEFVSQARQAADDQGCAEVIAFATSAVRDATNADDVLMRVNEAAAVDLSVLPGEAEARMTFLAVRRWFGWSSGRLGVFDIGGGSLELASGIDELPDVAISLPLGAVRLTREWVDSGRDTGEMRRSVRAQIAEHVGMVRRRGSFDHAVATSKTFRSLARVCGAAPSGEGAFVRRVLRHDDLKPLIGKLEGLSDDEVAALPGVSRERAHQLYAGAVVADVVMSLFELTELEICPWAMREGILLDRLDRL